MIPLSNETAEQRLQLRDHLLAAVLLMGFAFFINRGIEIKGLYMDDLYLWSCYGEQSFLEYVFPIGSTRFRFLYYLAAWLELALVGPHIRWIVPINIVLNGLLAFFLYVFGWKLSGRKLPGFLTGMLFLLSRMSYYQISQMYGLMETMALWMAVGIFWCLFRYLNGRQEEQDSRMFTAACWLYFGICFVHERYMVLLPVFFLVLLLKKRFSLTAWLKPAGTFLLVQLIRFATIGTVSPAGTGGTQVADTFSLAQAVKFAFSQVAYVFGINAGPEYLNGIAWWETPRYIKGLVYGADVILLAFLLAFVIVMVKNKKIRKHGLMNSALFIAFIAMCIASSSVTVRVEMRWVYVSYAMALLFLDYLCGLMAPPKGHLEKGREGSLRRFGMKDGAGPSQVKGDSAEANFLALHAPVPVVKKEHSSLSWLLCGGGFLVYLLLMLPAESFFRGNYPNLYLWPNQTRYNSLAEETYERYGDQIFGKTIYILGNSYEMSQFTADTFFKVFDPARKAEGAQVVFIEDIQDVGLVTDQMLVLREDPEHNGFQDITSFVKDLKLHVDYGLYDEGWMDEDCSFRLMCGAEGKVSITFMYPGILSGGEETKIYVNGSLYDTIPVTESIYYEEISALPYETLEIQIQNNFYMQNAQEQRGETRLSVLAEITTK